jgi:hypothetical protein
LDRRQWLTRTSLAIAGGLLLGNEAMEMYEKLTHKKVWAMGAMPRRFEIYAGFPPWPVLGGLVITHADTYPTSREYVAWRTI